MHVVHILYGGCDLNLVALVAQCHVWVEDVVDNAAYVRQIWLHDRPYSQHYGVTLFNPIDHLDVNVIADNIATVVEHHCGEADGDQS